MTDIADLVAKLGDHDPADDLQWSSGGVDRVLADNERSIALGRLRERIDFWLEVWPDVRRIVVAAQAYERAYANWHTHKDYSQASMLRLRATKSDLLAAVREES